MRSPLATTTSGSTRSTSARERPLDDALLARADVEIGDVEDARATAGAGYTLDVAMADESAEIFDDLYLGLRAGGALRKQRRGEPLTAEEQEALGRWQRLSPWRKAIAIGAFARRHLRARLHARRPRLRPLAQGLSRLCAA